MEIRENIIGKAKGFIGYQEGPNNDTIFGTWSGSPNQPWCASFVCYCLRQACIIPEQIPLFVSCTKGFAKFTEMGITTREHITPQVGDIIFFIWKQEEATPDHVGLVEFVENGKVHTIEGNRSDKVQRFEYDINSWQIYGYACPNYNNDNDENKEENTTSNEITYSLILKGSKGNLVRIAQQRLVEKGYSLPKYGVDGDFRAETESVVKQFQTDMNIAVDGKIGNDTWAKLNDANTKKLVSSYPGYLIKKGQRSEYVGRVQNRLIELGYSCGGYGIDKIFGNGTYNSVIAFQRENSLSPDGIVGPDTWNKMF